MRFTLEYEYKDWLVSRCVNLCSGYGSYRRLFEYLYSRQFYSVIPKDSNREHDGLDLRMQFSKEERYPYGYVYSQLDFPCNVLEMMLALAMRCEDEIMANGDDGDRTGEWLFFMISNMHISNLDDRTFDPDEAEKAVNRLLDRTYKRNGDGGLFLVRNHREDMRKAELWYQMCWYLNEIMDSENG